MITQHRAHGRFSRPGLFLAVVTLLLGTSCLPWGWGGSGPGPGGMMGPGTGGPGGMMGPGTSGPGGMMGPGMGGPGGMMGPGMGGQGGMMGPGTGGQGGMMGPGMMGGMGSYNPQAKPITIDQATDSVRRYLNAYGQGLSLVEVMEFARNFYAEIEEENTGIHAMELLIDKYTGQVYPEMGPNMMWNAKYGMMAQMMGTYYSGGTPATPMPIAPEQAKALAQQFLDASLPGLTAGEADTFYGYYTLHSMRDGKVAGMLSVNGNTGAVWYHTWHGDFIATKEF